MSDGIDRRGFSWRFERAMPLMSLGTFTPLVTPLFISASLMETAYYYINIIL